MQTIVNGGIYQADLKGTFDAEFSGNHPSVIIQNLKEPDIFYIIPLTTYDKKKWEKLRKNYCCRIESTNSIARIDKMQVRHKSSIPKRWFSAGRVLYPTPDELNFVSTKLIEYVNLSAQRMQKEYKKHYDNYTEFQKTCDLFFKEYQFSNFSVFNLNFTENSLIATCDIELAKELSYDDLNSTFREYFEYKNMVVRFDNGTKKIIITVKLNDAKALTLKEKYDIINSSKG